VDRGMKRDAIAGAIFGLLFGLVGVTLVAICVRRKWVEAPPSTDPAQATLTIYKDTGESGESYDVEMSIDTKGAKE
jgi:hypothetical protein